MEKQQNLARGRCRPDVHLMGPTGWTVEHLDACRSSDALCPVTGAAIDDDHFYIATGQSTVNGGPNIGGLIHHWNNHRNPL
jgi:hypothetical protein